MSKRCLVLSITGTLCLLLRSSAQERGGTPQPSPEHKKLGVFVGTWNDEAMMKPGPFGPGGKMNLTETSCQKFSIIQMFSLVVWEYKASCFPSGDGTTSRP